MESKYESAIILAGGMGTRMNGLGVVFPKCLLPAYDQPLLLRQLAHCAASGVRQVFVSIADKFADLIEASLKLAQLPSGMTVSCVRELRPLGAQHGLTALAPRVRGQACLLLLGDAYFGHQTPFDALFSSGLRPEQMVLGATSSSSPQRIACNIVVDEAGRVIRIVDKPAPESIVGNLRWTCLCALHAGVLDLASELLAAGLVRGPHLGDLLEALRAAGVTTGTLVVPELEQNVNTVDDLLVSTLLEARRAIAADGHRVRELDTAISSLLMRIGLTLAEVL
jgi:NDP-sugar pyrophosphorylase family protein